MFQVRAQGVEGEEEEEKKKKRVIRTDSFLVFLSFFYL